MTKATNLLRSHRLLLTWERLVLQLLRDAAGALGVASKDHNLHSDFFQKPLIALRAAIARCERGAK